MMGNPQPAMKGRTRLVPQLESRKRYASGKVMGLCLCQIVGFDGIFEKTQEDGSEIWYGDKHLAEVQEHVILLHNHCPLAS